MFYRISLGTLAAVMLAACALVAPARASASWSPRVCHEVAEGVAWQAEQALRHYRPPQSTYPPDVALLIVRTGVGGLQQHRCAPAIMGNALARRLTPRQREELFSHLPTDVVRYLRRALASK